VALRQAPGAVAFVFAAKRFSFRGVIARAGAIAHAGNLRRSEKLQLLPHNHIFPQPQAPKSVVDHAKIDQFPSNMILPFFARMRKTSGDGECAIPHPPKG
jgi:kynureninase